MFKSLEVLIRMKLDEEWKSGLKPDLERPRRSLLLSKVEMAAAIAGVSKHDDRVSRLAGGPESFLQFFCQVPSRESKFAGVIGAIQPNRVSTSVGVLYHNYI